MKMNAYSKGVRLSLMAAMLLGSSAYAGKIIGVDANASYVETTPLPTQHGFGGWNFGNVDVRIVHVDDFFTKIGDFNTTTGVYDVMDYNQSFESEIYNIVEYNAISGNTVGTTVMAHLHGKDWPVGEPAGIKIVNNDKSSNGKPENCIMTTSYLDANASGQNEPSGYLDADNPRPTLCSSPFQTHKRFKVNILPTTVEGVVPEINGTGKPIDIVFNLAGDPDTTVRRYEVLQKINNYTGMRLNGYTVEVLDENGTNNPALTLSLGEGENNTTDPVSDIWDNEDMANMSHGLWGPYEVHDGELRFDNGFFDYKRAYYPVTLSDDNYTISYAGDMLGGNYQAIFGNWLPSDWAPYGIFFDTDQNPLTDAKLMAFYGKAPGYTEDGWYKRTVVYNPDTPEVTPVYTWSLATEADFLEWSGEWYYVDIVEDVLNLGLNYIVNVGENVQIGKTFTIRITPHVDTNQMVPSYVAVGKPAIPTIPTDPVEPPVVIDPIVPPVTIIPTVPTSSSDGGSCTFNPNSKGIDTTVLLMLALGMFYPFRRRFIQ